MVGLGLAPAVVDCQHLLPRGRYCKRCPRALTTVDRAAAAAVAAVAAAAAAAAVAEAAAAVEEEEVEAEEVGAPEEQRRGHGERILLDGLCSAAPLWRTLPCRSPR